jgi:hypothetical protein
MANPRLELVSRAAYALQTPGQKMAMRKSADIALPQASSAKWCELFSGPKILDSYWRLGPICGYRLISGP